MLIIWAAALIVFVIVEAVTIGLASIWFALGALAAFICAWVGGKLWLQIVWFLLVSVATLLLTRPLAKRYIDTKIQPTNADRVIGMVGIVQETIDNLAGTGLVHIGGKVWTARSAKGDIIEAGETVLADAIEGVKLIVERETADIAAE